ncbi:MAG: NAD-dependent epimerase/dehydratase family protein [Acidobacteria bacterium]|nr:NAD-dependent epimerase/dehydratase family protein [Acidobacteriota bacterium]
MPHRILVTGATGFLGRALTPALREAGHEVIAMGSRDGSIVDHPLPFPGVAHIFHLAALTFVPDSWANPRAFYDVNVTGTVNVLEFARRSAASLTLLSTYVYGTPRWMPIDEDHPLEAFNPYGQTKICAEEAARFYQRVHGLPVTIVRPFNIYGPGQGGRWVVPSLVGRILSNDEPVVRMADLRPKRDFIYATDVVDLLVRTVGHPGGVYNVASGQGTSVEQLARLALDLAGSSKGLESKFEHRQNEVLDIAGDVSRAAAVFGWRPTTSLAEGLTRVIEAARIQPRGPEIE